MMSVTLFNARHIREMDSYTASSVVIMMDGRSEHYEDGRHIAIKDSYRITVQRSLMRYDDMMV